MIHRTGIEIEFGFDDEPLDVVVETLEDQGLDAAVEDYNHHTRDHWKVTTDSSCGYELVSPILTSTTVRTVAPAMRAVTEAGGYVNDQCGFHVHVEVPGDNDKFETGLAVAALYHDAYDLLVPLLRPSRHDNRYARFDDDRDDWLALLTADRYTAVNLQPIPRQGTIEFRQHHGTLNSRTALGWVYLCDALTAEGASGGTVDSLRKRLRYVSPPVVADMLETVGAPL